MPTTAEGRPRRIPHPDHVALFFNPSDKIGEFNRVVYKGHAGYDTLGAAVGLIGNHIAHIKDDDLSTRYSPVATSPASPTRIRLPSTCETPYAAALSPAGPPDPASHYPSTSATDPATDPHTTSWAELPRGPTHPPAHGSSWSSERDDNSIAQDPISKAEVHRMKEYIAALENDRVMLLEEASQLKQELKTMSQSGLGLSINAFEKRPFHNSATEIVQNLGSTCPKRNADQEEDDRSPNPEETEIDWRPTEPAAGSRRKQAATESGRR